MEKQAIIELTIQFVDNAAEYMQCSIAHLYVTEVGVEVLLPKPYSRRFHDFEEIQVYINNKPTKNYGKHQSNEKHFERFRDELVDVIHRANKKNFTGHCGAVYTMPSYTRNGKFEKWRVIFSIALPFDNEVMGIVYVMDDYWDNVVSEETESILDHVVRLDAEKAECLARLTWIDAELQRKADNDDDAGRRSDGDNDDDAGRRSDDDAGRRSDDDAGRQQTAEWTDSEERSCEDADADAEGTDSEERRGKDADDADQPQADNVERSMSDYDLYRDDMEEIKQRLEKHVRKVTREKERLIGTGRRTRSMPEVQEVSMVTGILRFYALIKRTADHIGRQKDHLQILRNTNLFMRMQRDDVYDYHPDERRSKYRYLEYFLHRCATKPDWFAKMSDRGEHPNTCAVARVAQSSPELWVFIRHARSYPRFITFDVRTIPFTFGLMTMFVPLWTAISKLPSNNVQAHVYSPKLTLLVNYACENDSAPSVQFADERNSRYEGGSSYYETYTEDRFVKHIKSRLKPFASAVDPTNYVRRDMFLISQDALRIAGESHGDGHVFLVVHEQTPAEEVLYIVDGIPYSEYEMLSCGPYTVDTRVVLKTVLRLFQCAFSHSKETQSHITVREQPIIIQEYIDVLASDGVPGFKYDCTFNAMSNIARLHVYPAFRDICSYDIKDTSTVDDFVVFWSYIRRRMTRLYQDVVVKKQGYLLNSNIPGELVENGFFWEIDMNGRKVRKLQFIDYKMIDVTDAHEQREHRRGCTVQANMDF